MAEHRPDTSGWNCIQATSHYGSMLADVCDAWTTVPDYPTMWDVNVFDYFRCEPAVPDTEHSRFWPKADACMRQAGLDPQQRLAEIQTCKLQLQNTQDETQTLADLRKRLPAFSWKQELRDFPLFMAIYAGGLLGLYEHILVPLAEHRPLQMDMAVTPGLLLQCVWVYLILKALLWLLAGHKPGWTYWSGIIAAFCLYLAGIWLSTRLAQPVLFSVNVWLLTAILALVTWLLWPGRSCTGHERPFPRERRK